MAKLKIFKNNDPATKKPGAQGYINVVKKLIEDTANYEEFLEAEPNERAELLNDWAGANFDVYHELKNPPPPPAPQEEVIDQKNCKIMVEVDRRKFRRRSKHTISLPDAPPANVDYLKPYVDAIVLLNNGDAANPPNPADARRFLFGIMLLTRCR